MLSGLVRQRTKKIWLAIMAVPKRKNNMRSKKPREGATEYKPEFCDIARTLCEEGATDADLAAYFHVTISMISRWQKEHSEFFDACKSGKFRVDARVERAVYTRAVGHARDVEKVMQHKGKQVLVRYRSEMLPDVATANFWLRNRSKADWNDGPDGPQDEHPLRALARQLLEQARAMIKSPASSTESDDYDAEKDEE